MHSVSEAWVSLQLTNSAALRFRNWSFTNKKGGFVYASKLVSFIKNIVIID
jgi:hypothetical protein